MFCLFAGEELMAMTTEERFESIEKRLDGFEERLSRIEELLRDRQKAQDEDEKEQIQNRQQAADHEKDDTAPATEKNGLAKNQGQERQDEAGKTSPEPTQKQPQPDNGFFDAEEKRLDEIAKEFNANLQKMRDDLAKRRAAAEQAPEEEKKGLLARFSDWMHNIYQNNVNELRKILGMRPLEEKKEPENRTAAETVVNQQSPDKDAEIERLKKLVDDLKAKLKQQDKEPEKSSEKTPDPHEQKPVEDRTGKTPGSVKESAEQEITSENKGPSKTEPEVKNQQPQAPSAMGEDTKVEDKTTEAKTAFNPFNGLKITPLVDAEKCKNQSAKNAVSSEYLFTPQDFAMVYMYVEKVYAGVNSHTDSGRSVSGHRDDPTENSFIQAGDDLERGLGNAIAVPVRDEDGHPALAYSLADLNTDKLTFNNVKNSDECRKEFKRLLKNGLQTDRNGSRAERFKTSAMNEVKEYFKQVNASVLKTEDQSLEAAVKWMKTLMIDSQKAAYNFNNALTNILRDGRHFIDISGGIKSVDMIDGTAFLKNDSSKLNARNEAYLNSKEQKIAGSVR